jgi:hypothetical protein
MALGQLYFGIRRALNGKKMGKLLICCSLNKN